MRKLPDYFQKCLHHFTCVSGEKNKDYTRHMHFNGQAAEKALQTRRRTAHCRVRPFLASQLQAKRLHPVQGTAGSSRKQVLLSVLRAPVFKERFLSRPGTPRGHHSDAVGAPDLLEFCRHRPWEHHAARRRTDCWAV
uniref:RNA 3'-terminal phosphate cyclase n=1 Tax=Molossus molossus TaxID=27622 RepID=A0A7J8CTY6_MOLMO|nr:RNA 3'-terminal phosphate cyclase [Molossus molossus]